MAAKLYGVSLKIWPRSAAVRVGCQALVLPVNEVYDFVVAAQSLFPCLVKSLPEFRFRSKSLINERPKGVCDNTSFRRATMSFAEIG